VRASYADFIWGLPATTDELFPRLGVSTRGEEDGSRRTVIHVDEDSVAARSGFEVGDLLLAIDGRDVPDREALNRVMSEMRWGDTAVFTVRRGEEAVELDVAFRRVREKDRE
jgi:S1-C subfamily serine protease